MPIQMLVSGVGIRGVLVNQQLLDEQRKPLLSAMLQNAVDLGLFELIYEGNAYRCPLALAGTCDGRTDSCTAGIESFAQLPDDKVCLVRRGLYRLGYAI
jgi:hypothetical protein